MELVPFTLASKTLKYVNKEVKDFYIWEDTRGLKDVSILIDWYK